MAADALWPIASHQWSSRNGVKMLILGDSSRRSFSGTGTDLLSPETMTNVRSQPNGASPSSAFIQRRNRNLANENNPLVRCRGARGGRQWERNFPFKCSVWFKFHKSMIPAIVRSIFRRESTKCDHSKIGEREFQLECESNRHKTKLASLSLKSPVQIEKATWH